MSTMEFDKNNSPFIPLPPPHTDIIVTPPRYTDGDAIIRNFNDPKVYMNLVTPPYPFTRQDWDERFPIIERQAHDALLEWKEAEASRLNAVAGEAEGMQRKWVGIGFPVTAIREIDPKTREETFIGDISIRRREFKVTLDEGERKRARDENFDLEAGDPRIAWDVGCTSSFRPSPPMGAIACEPADCDSPPFSHGPWARDYACSARYTHKYVHDSIYEYTPFNGSLS